MVVPLLRRIINVALPIGLIAIGAYGLVELVGGHRTIVKASSLLLVAGVMWLYDDFYGAP